VPGWFAAAAEKQTYINSTERIESRIVQTIQVRLHKPFSGLIEAKKIDRHAGFSCLLICAP
jgi:hypothetical protein